MNNRFRGIISGLVGLVCGVVVWGFLDIRNNFSSGVCGFPARKPIKAKPGPKSWQKGGIVAPQTLEEMVNTLGIDNVRRVAEYAAKRIKLYETPKVDFITFVNGKVQARVRRFNGSQSMLNASSCGVWAVVFTDGEDTVTVYKNGEVRLNGTLNMEMYPQAVTKLVEQVSSEERA